MTKLNFQQPILQSSVSHDPSKIILICWFAAQESIWWKESSKEQNLYEIYFFNNISNINYSSGTLISYVTTKQKTQTLALSYVKQVFCKF